MGVSSRSTPVFLLCTAVLAALGTAPGAAQIALGPELQINVWTTSAQEAAAVAGDAAGEFVVAWQSYDQSQGACYGYAGTLCNGVYGRRLDRAGRFAGGEIQLQQTNTVTQQRPDLAKRTTGEFVVVWDDDLFFFAPGNALYRRFDAAGQPAGPAAVANGGFAGTQRGPAVAMDATGGFVVVWDYQSDDLMERGILGRRFDADGAPLSGDLVVSGPSATGVGFPDVAASDSGRFVVVWADSQLGAAARLYDEAGVPVGESFPLASSGALGYPAVAMHGSGSFVAVWNSIGGASVDVAAQRFDPNGVPVGNRWTVNGFTAGEQGRPAVAMDAGGDFLVTWESASQDGSGKGVFARRFDALGAPLGAEFQVNAFTTGDQAEPAAAATPAGDFLVVWQSTGQDGSSTGVFGRLIRVAQFADGFESGDTCAWSSTVGGGCP